MTTYADIGINKIVNASANNSKAGSACMSKPVLEAMSKAAEWYVDMDQLHIKCGEYIAQITGAQAGLITSGACGGLLLAAAACATRNNRSKMLSLPVSAEGKEIIVQKGHRSGYDMAVQASGVTLVEVGLPFLTYPDEIVDAINEKTVAILFTIGEFISSKGEVPLEQIIKIGKDHKIPVILDGSLIVFPFDRLRSYINMGVDLLSASGGKHIFGPPGTGFLCGNSDLIEACRLQAGPAFGIGRPLKIGKEEMMGLVTALDLYLKRDKNKEAQKWKTSAVFLKKAMKKLQHIQLEITEKDEVGRPIPRVKITLDEEKSGVTAFEVVAKLKNNPPYIWVQEFHLKDGIIFLNPICFQDGDEEKIITGFSNLWKKLGFL